MMMIIKSNVLNEANHRFFLQEFTCCTKSNLELFFFPRWCHSKGLLTISLPTSENGRGREETQQTWQNPLNFTQFPKYEPHQHLWINFSHRGWSCFWKFGMWLAGISMTEGLVQAFVLLQRCWFVCSSVLTKNSWIDVGSWTVSKTMSSSWMLLLLVVSCFFLQTWKVS